MKNFDLETLSKLASTGLLGSKYLRRERHSSSRIQRAFYLGDIDESTIKANFNNGVLKIEASKKELESNRKTIDIE